MIMPMELVKYIPLVATAISLCSRLLVSAINDDAWTIPVPKPLGIISNASSTEIFPFQRKIKSRYEIELAVVARVIKRLYLPVLWITIPVMRVPTVFPNTAGMRYDPAAVIEAPWVTWKYRGTENII